MKVYLINLDKDVERLAAADAQLRRLDVDYERVRAIYAKELTTEEKRRAVNRFRWWLAVGRAWRPGEIGCALSHFMIYRRMVEEGIPYACVLEDDILLSGNLGERLDRLEKFIDPKLPQVILLSCHHGKKMDDFEIEATDTDMFAEAYVITQVAAKALLKENFPLKTPCDHWGRWVKLGLIKLYHSFPAIANQNWSGYKSNIGQSCVKIVKDAFYKRVLRHLGFACDRTLLLVEVVWRRFR